MTCTSQIKYKSGFFKQNHILDYQSTTNIFCEYPFTNSSKVGLLIKWNFHLDIGVWKDRHCTKETKAS